MKATVLRKDKAEPGLYAWSDVEDIYEDVLNDAGFPTGATKHTGRKQFKLNARPVDQEDLQEPNSNVAVYLCGPGGNPELRELRSDGNLIIPPSEKHYG